MNISTTVGYTQNFFSSKTAEILIFVLLSLIASIVGCRVKKSQCTKAGRDFIFNFQAAGEEETKTEEPK